MSKTSFDIIEEISDDISVKPEIPPDAQPSTSGMSRGKPSKKSTSSSPGPSTSRGTGGQSINNYLEISSDTSSAAGFKMDHIGQVVSSSSTPSHLHRPPLTPEIEPINLIDSGPAQGASTSGLGDPLVISARSPQISASNASNFDYLLSLLPPAELNEVPVEDPIVIRGNGNMTLFGLSNSFSNTFPSSLLGRVSREEFEATMGQINCLLRKNHSTNAKILLLGCLCCCCSLGCSLLWPTFALSKRTRHSLEKVSN